MGSFVDNATVAAELDVDGGKLAGDCVRLVVPTAYHRVVRVRAAHRRHFSFDTLTARTAQYTNSAFHLSGVGKSSIGLSTRLIRGVFTCVR